MLMARKDWLQQNLTEWAQWMESRHAYSRSTIIGRAMAGQKIGTVFGPQEPNNIEAPYGWMRRMVITMADCQAIPKKARYITAMQLYYLLGPDEVIRILGRPSSTLRRWKLRGEDILRRALKS